MEHWSCCAIYNGPALPTGPCNCGGVPEFGSDFLDISDKLIKVRAGHKFINDPLFASELYRLDDSGRWVVTDAPQAVD